MTLELSTILVDSKEDQKVVNRFTGQRRELVADLRARGFNAEPKSNLPVDLMWSAGGRSVMFDLATPDDMMHKSIDGRLRTQSDAMKARDCLLWGFLIEGGWGGDGITVGYGRHAWAAERLDNLIVSLQQEGATIAHSTRPSRSPVRIGALWTWSGAEEHGRWHRVKPMAHVDNRVRDKLLRSQMEMLMCLPGLGQERAHKALQMYPLQDLLDMRDGDAFVARWSSVPKVGQQTAKNILGFLRESRVS